MVDGESLNTLLLLNFRIIINKMPKSIRSQSEIAQSVKYLTVEWMMGVTMK
jgi:hypothetical protein